jgi:hypothetical protein
MDNDLSEQLADAWLTLQQAHYLVEGTPQTARGYDDLLDALKVALRDYYRVIERIERAAKEEASGN